MSVPVVTSNPQEFLEALLDTIKDSQDFTDDVEFSISTLHRKDSEDTTVVPAVFEVHSDVDYSSDKADSVQLMHPVTYDQYMLIMDKVIADFKPRACLNSFAIKQMQQTIMSVFEREYSDDENQADALSHLFDKAIYQGLACKFTLTLVNNRLTLNFAVSVELYADTSQQEAEILKEKGLNPAAVSDPNKMVLIFEQTVHSYQSIL